MAQKLINIRTDGSIETMINKYTKK